MATKFPVRLTKGSQVRTAHTQSDVVRFQFDGFTVDGDAKAELGTSVPQEKAFDPADHTVEQVQDYLASADEAEAQRVLSAERKGKNRSTLVG